MFKLLGNGDGQLPAEINNPFSMEHIEKISMYCSKDIFDDGFSIRGYVEFRNGETKGEQKFEAKSLGELFVKIHSFCERLGVSRY